MHNKTKHDRLRARTLSLLALCASTGLLLSACSASASSPEVTPAAEAPVESYEIPDGCPTADDFAASMNMEPGFAEAIDVGLIDAEVSHPLVPGGCAFAVGDVGTVESTGSQFRSIRVVWFNTDAPGKATQAELRDWGLAAGGTPYAEEDFLGEPTGEYSETNLDLPDSFTRWTNADLMFYPAESQALSESDPIRPFTHGSDALLLMSLSAEVAQAMIDATSTGTVTADPTTALASGLAASFSSTITAEDDEGYSAQLTVSGSLDPFAANVTDSPPGQMRVTTQSQIGGSTTNTTEGRKVTTPRVDVLLLYPRESSACTGTNRVSLEGGGELDGDFCEVRIGNLSETELAPAETLDFSPEALVVTSENEIAEAGSGLTEFNTPTSIYLKLVDGSNSAISVNWESSAGCMVSFDNTGAAWVQPADGWPDVLC